MLHALHWIVKGTNDFAFFFFFFDREPGGDGSCIHVASDGAPAAGVRFVMNGTRANANGPAQHVPRASYVRLAHMPVDTYRRAGNPWTDLCTCHSSPPSTIAHRGTGCVNYLVSDTQTDEKTLITLCVLHRVIIISL